MRYLRYLTTSLGLFTAFAALLGIYDEFLVDGVKGVLLLILDKYEQITSPVFLFISPVFLHCARLLSIWTGLHFSLYPHWKDVFTLLMLYISAHISHAFVGQLPAPRTAATVRMIWGLICAVLASVAAGIAPLRGVAQITVTLLFCVVGVVVYRLGFAVQFALDRRIYAGQRFRSEFGRKAGGALALAILGTIVLAMGAWAEKHWSIGAVKAPGFVILVALLITLGAFHLWLGVAAGLRGPCNKGNEFWSQLWGKGNIRIGVRIFLTVGLTVAAIAGLS